MTPRRARPLALLAATLSGLVLAACGGSKIADTLPSATPPHLIPATDSTLDHLGPTDPAERRNRLDDDELDLEQRRHIDVRRAEQPSHDAGHDHARDDHAGDDRRHHTLHGQHARDDHAGDDQLRLEHRRRRQRRHADPAGLGVDRHGRRACDG